MAPKKQAVAAVVQVCAQCGATAKNACARCKSVWYCGADCQRVHWTKGGHKGQCGAVVRSGEGSSAHRTVTGATAPAAASVPSSNDAVSRAVTKSATTAGVTFEYLFPSADDPGRDDGSWDAASSVAKAERLVPEDKVLRLLSVDKRFLANDSKLLEPVPLKNLGNSCFMNSVLQCLLGTTAMRTALKWNEEAPGGNCPRAARGESCIRCLLKDGVEQYEKLVSDQYVYLPRPLFRALPTLGDFQPGLQADAQDYFMQLISRLSSCMIEDAMRARLQAQFTDKKAPVCPPALAQTALIEQVFGGAVQSRVQCATCKYSSTKFDMIQEMMLELTDCESIEQAIEKFTNIEEIDGWRCERCQVPRVGRKQLTLMRPPNLLVTTLKRFDYIYGGRKITKRIAFREDLHLSHVLSRSSPFAAQGAHYKLYAVVVHFGPSIMAGHYVSFVKSPTGQWYLCDDENVFAVSFSTVLKQNAYMLFYQRDDSVKGSTSRTLIGDAANNKAEDDIATAATSTSLSDSASSLSESGGDGKSALASSAGADADVEPARASSPAPPPPTKPTGNFPPYVVYHIDEASEDLGSFDSADVGVGAFALRISLKKFPDHASGNWIDVKAAKSGHIFVDGSLFLAEGQYPYDEMTIKIPFQITSVKALYFYKDRTLVVTALALAAGADSDCKDLDWVITRDADILSSAFLEVYGFSSDTEVDRAEPEKEPQPPPSSVRTMRPEDFGEDEASYQALMDDIVSTHHRGVRTIAPQTKGEPEKLAKVGRNEQCPCGSGRKYKSCHGK